MSLSIINYQMDKITFKVRLDAAEKKKATHLNLYSLGIDNLPEKLAELKWIKSIDLANNRMDTIPEVLTRMSGLEELYLGYNNISELPPHISSFRNLKILSLKNNHIKSLPDSFGKMESLEKIDLNANKLDTLPESIKNLRKLRELSLISNKLRYIPKEIFQIKTLERLELDDNSIEEIGDAIEELEQLLILSVYGNRIKKISPRLGNLVNLVYLDLSRNNLKEVPGDLFHLPRIKTVGYHNSGSRTVTFDTSRGKEILTSSIMDLNHIVLNGNPISNPPLELLRQGLDSIKNYFRELKESDSFLYEAKLLILGEPGAGKTSLCVKVIDPAKSLPDEEETTRGIDIFKYTFLTKQQTNFVVNMWDFGGQEIYHSTHQFFLSKRSLYILLTDNRAENTQFNYWLNLIELLSDNSPLLIIQNEKQGRKKAIDERGIKFRFNNLLATMQTDLSSGDGLKSIINEIEHNIQKLPHIGIKLPNSWVEIRKRLEDEAKNVPYISQEEYFNICRSYNLTTKTRALHLSEYLHDIGSFLHYQDNTLLKRWLILNPVWATEAVYKILDNTDVIKNFGCFNNQDINNIWNVDLYSEMKDELLELMLRYEICYYLEDEDMYIAPQLLPIEQPEYFWEFRRSRALIIKYVYKFMPRGIMTQLIVRLHRYLKDRQSAWRTGAIFKWGDAEAEIVETYAENEIVIKVKGEDRKALFLLISESLERLTVKYANIKFDKKIPCNCNKCLNSPDAHQFNYDALKSRLNRGKKEIECENSLEAMTILKLLGEYYESDKIYKVINDSFDIVPKIFVSYSHKDNSYKDQLRKQLKVLERSQKIKIWDDHAIDLGREWNTEIMYNLDTSDIILLLISPDFINSKFCYEIEMIRALERHENQDALVIPIILRSCLWEETPFSKLQGIIPDGGAVDNKLKSDKIWTNIAVQLNEAVDTWKKKKLRKI